MIRKPLDLVKIREADALMREARRLDPQVRIPSMSDLKRMLPVPKTKDKTTGRPRGAEPTVTIALRIPQSMCDQLDARVARLEAETGLKGARTAICRRALQLYLEEEPSLPKPKASRQRTQKATRS